MVLLFSLFSPFPAGEKGMIVDLVLFFSPPLSFSVKRREEIGLLFFHSVGKGGPLPSLFFSSLVIDKKVSFLSPRLR